MGDGLGLDGGAAVRVEGHGVLDGVPLGIEGEVGLDGGAEVVGLGQRLVGVPALEGVAAPGGVRGPLRLRAGLQVAIYSLLLTQAPTLCVEQSKATPSRSTSSPEQR